MAVDTRVLAVSIVQGGVGRNTSVVVATVEGVASLVSGKTERDEGSGSETSSTTGILAICGHIIDKTTRGENAITVRLHLIAVGSSGGGLVHTLALGQRQSMSEVSQTRGRCRSAEGDSDGGVVGTTLSSVARGGGRVGHAAS
jgi:hypothetical protein